MLRDLTVNELLLIHLPVKSHDTLYGSCNVNMALTEKTKPMNHLYQLDRQKLNPIKSKMTFDSEYEGQ